MTTLTLDIETIPDQRPGAYEEILRQITEESSQEMANIKAPANYKDEAKISEYIERQRQQIQEGIVAKAEEQYRRTSLDSAAGTICCIGWAENNETAKTLCIDEEGEAKLLRDFFLPVWNMSNNMQLIGHNITGFDLRFIRHRAIINRIVLPVQLQQEAKPWESDKVFDTMIQWAGVGKTISQDKLSKALGGKGKSGIDGSMVWDYYQQGRIAEIAEYCADDVEQCRYNYKRMTFQI